VIRPDSVILSFGRERSGDKSGQLVVSISRNKIKEMTDQELRDLQQLVRQAFETIIHEEQFRRVKVAQPITEPTKEIT
jgi:hypothetical protein